MNAVHLTQIVPESLKGKRLDQALAILLPDYSRMRIKIWINQQQVTVDGAIWQPTTKVKGNEVVEINGEVPCAVEWVGQNIELNIVYVDQDLIIVNKPAGLVVHPAAGHAGGTLVNAILHQFPECAHLPRGGIVHRLDKDTSGLMMVARSIPAHTALIKAIQQRTVKREYDAIVQRELISGGTVDAPIGRHPGNRIRMAIRDDGKDAVTHYRVIERFPGYTHILCQLETGRTHQIRVHMAHIGYPLLGDPQYGGRARVPPKQASEKLRYYLSHFKRQALHARQLTLAHPVTGEPLVFTAPMPEDMQILLRLLQELKS